MLVAQAELLLMDLIASIAKSEFLPIEQRVKMIKEIIYGYDIFTNK